MYAYFGGGFYALEALAERKEQETFTQKTSNGHKAAAFGVSSPRFSANNNHNHNNNNNNYNNDNSNNNHKINAGSVSLGVRGASPRGDAELELNPNGGFSHMFASVARNLAGNDAFSGGNSPRLRRLVPGKKKQKARERTEESVVQQRGQASCSDKPRNASTNAHGNGNEQVRRGGPDLAAENSREISHEKSREIGHEKSRGKGCEKSREIAVGDCYSEGEAARDSEGDENEHLGDQDGDRTHDVSTAAKTTPAGQISPSKRIGAKNKAGGRRYTSIVSPGMAVRLSQVHMRSTKRHPSQDAAGHNTGCAC